MRPAGNPARRRRGRLLVGLGGAVCVVSLAWALARADGVRDADRLKVAELGTPLGSTIRFQGPAGGLRSLADTAPTYRVIGKRMSKAEAEALAEACGIDSGVQKGDVRSMGHLFVAGNRRLQLHVYTEPGCAKFADRTRLWVPNGSIVLPDEGDAAQGARAFLVALGRAPTGDVFVSDVGPTGVRTRRDAEGNLVREPLGFSVGFRRRLSGYDVMGYGHTSVEFGSDGKPARFFQVWRAVEEEGEVPLIGVKAALSRLREGQAGFRGLEGRTGTALVKSVRLVYWERPPDARQLFLEPVYEFSGTLTPGQGGTPLPFTARVPAVDKERARDLEE